MISININLEFFGFFTYIIGTESYIKKKYNEPEKKTFCIFAYYDACKFRLITGYYSQTNLKTAKIFNVNLLLIT